MNVTYLAEKFDKALPYRAYVHTGSAEQQRLETGGESPIFPAQKQLVAGFQRNMRVLIVSGIWCGDCVQQCPLLHRIAEANSSRIDLRLLDRDQNRDLAEQIHINAGERMPVALFLAEGYELLRRLRRAIVDPISRVARAQLGAVMPHRHRAAGFG